MKKVFGLLNVLYRVRMRVKQFKSTLEFLSHRFSHLKFLVSKKVAVKTLYPASRMCLRTCITSVIPFIVFP